MAVEWVVFIRDVNGDLRFQGIDRDHKATEAKEVVKQIADGNAQGEYIAVRWDQRQEFKNKLKAEVTEIDLASVTELKG